MDIKYDKQSDKWQECINNEDKNKFSKNWLREDTLDSWRHQRMLKPLKAFFSIGDKWLTIGDGRYGTEANYLIKCGLEAHATDLSDQLLKISNKNGYINEYSKQNAEDLKFDDNSFDYVLIKEALHHCPRPWIALNEAFRVCKKGVILIEPNDQLAGKLNIVKLLINISKKILRKNNNLSDYNFEEVGNFIFTINPREIEKYMLAMHYRYLSFMRMNDFYFKGIEEISLKKPKFTELIKIIFLKSIILIKDTLCFLRLTKHSLICVALFKQSPNENEEIYLRKNNWVLKRLPKNPFIN